MPLETVRVRTWRPRFSLLSLVLLTTVVAAVLGLLIASIRHRAEMQQASSRHRAAMRRALDENARLKKELHYLAVTDPTQVAGTRIENRNPHLRRWRLYLPPGTRWRLGIFSGLIPSRGYDIDGATNRRNSHYPMMVDLGTAVPPEGVVLEAGFFNHHNEGWVMQVEGPAGVVPAGGVTARLTGNVTTFLEGERRWGTIGESADIQVGQSSHRPDRPIDLWRKMWIARDNPPSGHKPGFIVWIEPVPQE